VIDLSVGEESGWRRVGLEENKVDQVLGGICWRFGKGEANGNRRSGSSPGARSSRMGVDLKGIACDLAGRRGGRTLALK
jgi:hypothetical protein